MTELLIIALLPVAIIALMLAVIIVAGHFLD